MHLSVSLRRRWIRRRRLRYCRGRWRSSRGQCSTGITRTKRSRYLWCGWPTSCPPARERTTRTLMTESTSSSFMSTCQNRGRRRRSTSSVDCIRMPSAFTPSASGPRLLAPVPYASTQAASSSKAWTLFFKLIFSTSVIFMLPIYIHMAFSPEIEVISFLSCLRVASQSSSFVTIFLNLNSRIILFKICFISVPPCENLGKQEKHGTFMSFGNQLSHKF